MKKILLTILVLLSLGAIAQTEKEHSGNYGWKDSIRFYKQAQYQANYGSSFNNRSLVDKGYTDSADALRVPNSRTITINGTPLDLSANRTWSVGTVTNFSFNDGNGFVHSISNATTTPALGIGLVNDGTATEKKIIVHNGAVYQQTAKAIPDADYTIGATDYYILLPDPSTTRTLTLGAASSFKGKHLIIDCRSTSTGEWMLSGSFLQAGTVGTYTEDFVNSGLVTGKIYELMSIEVSTGTWKWVQIRAI